MPRKKPTVIGGYCNECDKNTRMNKRWLEIQYINRYISPDVAIVQIPCEKCGSHLLYTPLMGMNGFADLLRPRRG